MFGGESFFGEPFFGFDPHEIGNRSIRPGAAMALFLSDHSPAKIMILGRWKSDAFLDYIRPQVLEWTHSRSEDMSNFDSFLDISIPARADPSKLRNHRILNGRTSISVMARSGVVLDVRSASASDFREDRLKIGPRFENIRWIVQHHCGTVAATVFEHTGGNSGSTPPLHRPAMEAS